jgi:formate dehydrogenase subunit gamma
MNRFSQLLYAFGLLVAFALPGGALAQQPNGANPTSQAVKEEQLLQELGKVQGTISIPDGKAAVLQQPQGRDYRQYREGPLPWIGALAILGMVALLAAFFFTRGRIKLADSPQMGVKIKRFNAFERFAHWITASTFLILAVSGLNYIFGKRLLFPLIGPDAFAVWSQYAKYAHLYLSWPFMLGVAIMFVVWVKDNIPNRIDMAWLKAGGGLIGRGHPDAERFNAGQKGIFWSVVLFGTAMSVTGIIMMFPFSLADINGMQLSQIIHATIGMIFIAIMIAHIYIGSLGMEGAYDAMGSGDVDLAWAKEHHNLWVEEEIAKGRAPRTPPGAHAAPAE